MVQSKLEGGAEGANSEPCFVLLCRRQRKNIVKMTKMKDKQSKMTVMEVMYDGYSGVGRTINIVGGVVLE